MNGRRMCTVILALIFACWPVRAEAQKAVYLVRHAEKAGDALTSPLTEKGGRRAQALARLLKDAGIKAIYTSDFRRTQLTAKPLADQLRITPKAILNGDADTTFNEVRRDHLADIVLVVGHSNTIPALVKKWTGKDVPAPEESEY